MIKLIKNLFSNKDKVPEKQAETISSLEFKKQISKRLSENFRTLGFNGSGFHYKLISDNFIFTIGIQPNRYGGSCCAEFGIQPIELVDDVKKIKYYDCEFRTRVFDNEKGDKLWSYSKIEKENLKIADDIFQIFHNNYFRLVEKFNSEIYPFDNIKPIDINDFGNLQKNIFDGYLIGITEIRFLWAMSKIYENKNLNKSKEFAKIGLEMLDKNNRFFGKKDFERILAK